ncbi:hypothetical protein ACO0SA_001420 [Hanseniaspora valbyensis]
MVLSSNTSPSSNSNNNETNSIETYTKSEQINGDIITINLTENYDKIEPTKEEGNNPNEPRYYSGFKLAIIQFSLNLAVFVIAMDICIVAAPLESISEQFAKYSLSSWIMSAYSLSSAMGCTLWSRISVKLGKKMSIIVAILGFELGSLITATATNMYMLIVGRVIQGCFGSGLNTVSFIISSTLVPEEKRAFLLSLLSISFSVGSVTPILGGALSEAYKEGWRLCFYINLPIGFLALTLFQSVYDDGVCPPLLTIGKKIAQVHKYKFKSFFKSITTRKTYIKLLVELLVSFDMINFILVSTGFILFLLAVTFAGGFQKNWRWYERNCIALLIVGPILLVSGILYDCFYYFKVVDYLRKKYGDQIEFPPKSTIGPLMTEKLFFNFKIVSVNVVACFVCLANGCQSVYIIQYFQLLFNYSPLIASVNFMPSMLSISAFVLFSGFLISKTGRVKPLIYLAAATGLLGNGLLTLLKDTSNEAEKLIFVFIGGLGFGFIAQSSLLSAQRELDSEDPRYRMDFISITGCNAFSKQVGLCIGSVVSTMVFNTSVMNKINSDFPEYSYLKPDTLIAFRRKNFDGRHSVFSKMLSSCIQNVFYFATGASVIPLFFCWFASNKKIMTKKQLKKIKDEEQEQSDIEKAFDSNEEKQDIEIDETKQ